ncbi:triple tyrosine motif-containing protein [Prolixibacteraceae bacterium Z1-6]|uniref:Triple tyrosine motif-containing protein n=1 Tax=Draconibacterium aestuarii TaxID=2998507 RepID=A0A9X3F5P5_9BACT|nr:triple tyrosine motif-containing protein [Prolixibacteraceae bacterium Z1-6]
MLKSAIILLLLLPFCAFAQVKTIGTPNVQNYPKTVYKAGTQNWDIAEDKKGFMYFANNDGVLIFDGFHWELIEVPLSLVRTILVDSQDRIFVGLLYDFGMLKKTPSGKYVYQSLVNLVPKDSREFNDVWKIHEINGNIVFQSYEKLFIYDGTQIKVLNPVNKFHFSFNVNGRLLIQEPGIGLFELFNGFIEKVPWADRLKDFQILSILEINENHLLIGTAQDGLYYYEHGKLEPWETEVNKAVKNSKLFSATTVLGNHLAFGTILDGLYISDQDGRIIQRINKSNELLNNTILSVFSDQEKNLWLGLDNGIGYVEVNSPVSYITARGGLGTGYCCQIFDNKLYMGTNQGLFVKPFTDIGQNTEYFELVENSEGQVWSLGVFDGQLICGHNFGTYAVEDNVATKISEVPGGWIYIPLKNYPDYLLGGHYNGLILLEKKASGWEFKNKLKGFDVSSRFLFQDKSGEIWMSHGGKGIYRLSINEALDSVVNIKLYNDRNGLPSAAQNILFDLYGEKYVSTVDGVYEFNASADAFKPAEEINKLFGLRERIKKVVTDDSENIWYISEGESGVLRKNEDLTYTKISSPFESLNEHYVSEFEFVYPRNNDHVFFGIDDGFAHYSSKFPKSFVQEFRSFITKVELSYLDSVIYPQQFDGVRYEFPFRKNSFRFHYTSPFFENLLDLRFSYFLENYSEDWSVWTTDIYKDFTNLPFGEYSFKIKALNNYGIESDIHELNFVVLPPWYHTSLAYTLYIILLLVTIILAILFVQYRINRSKELEKQKHRKELHAKEEAFQHQAVVAEKEIIKLRNERLRADMIYRDKELANQTNAIIQKNKFLRKLNDELKLLQNSTDDASVRTKIAVIKQRISKETENKQQKVFETYFDEVHEAFFDRLKKRFPQLSPRDLRLCAYIRMNISTKEIATLLNISDRGVEITRYRLRKKLELPREINLSIFLSGI